MVIETIIPLRLSMASPMLYYNECPIPKVVSTYENVQIKTR
jgi:hypothetical protein